MLDINKMKELESNALKQRIENEKQKQLKENIRYEEIRQKRFGEMEAGRKKAEEAFPEYLKNAEKTIIDAIQYNKRNVQISCYLSNEWATMYLQIMFVQVLPLKGLICNMSEHYVNVSW